ncbi:MAG TPA: lipid II flippase MurJ [Acidimicrobiales bacterium]
MTAPNSVGRSAVGMGAAAAASRVLGGARVLVVAAVLGTTWLGDTFEAANTFPTVIFELLAAGALSAVLVPTFVDLFAREQRPEAEHQAGGLLGLALVVLGSLTVVGMIAAPWLADALTGASDAPAQQQELATSLLRWFLPQLLLYPIGFCAIALLNAKRVFALPAAAPIGNTVVLVSALLIFYAVAGADPGLDLTTGETALLGLGGTLGVAAFVAIPTVALWRTGFRLWPRWAPRDPGVRRLVGLSSWAVLQHSGAALLLGAAIVLGAGVEGGVVSYRVAFYLFLAPYGILAQPLHTTVQPELADDVDRGDLEGFGRAMRWALASLGVVVLPVAGLMVALARPAMEVLAFGQADSGDGVALMAAGVAGLALGLPAYGAFRLLAAAWYALDDSRTPALAAIGSAVIGVGLMIALAPFTDGPSRIFALGLGHTVGFLLGTLWLALRLRHHQPVALWPRTLPAITALAAVLAGAAWVAVDAWSPDGRLATAVALGLVGIVAGGLYYGALRGLHLLPGPLVRNPAVAS